MHIFWIPDKKPSNTKVPPLPPELISTILDHTPRSDLTQLAQVSKSWYAEAMPRLYRHLYVSTPHHWDCLVRTMANPDFTMGQYVQSLVLRPSPKLAPSSRFSKVWKQHGAPPGYVRVEAIDFNRTGLEHIDDNYPELDTTQKEAEWLGSSVSPKDIAVVLGRCASSIAYIDVGGCERLGDQVLEYCSKNGPPSSSSSSSSITQLKGLWVPLVRGITPAGLSHLATKVNPHLRHVDLSFSLKITDDALINAVECWPNLTHLRLNSLYHITDASIVAIAQSCPNLQLLYLVRCWHVTNDALAVIAQKCPELVYVSVAFLNRTTEEGVGQLIKQLPKLRWIDITGCGINSLFKPMFIGSWTKARQERGWDTIEFNDSTVALL
ncbi:hypothetical protein BDB00DRAFT_786945 [Zychaea mexicana]|uniref:uncharacterized protein n=1 Tax=Zychaea mexicana TaxID=64656 RepID=UPI0022FDEDF3|nr:uncharacterized protein BDB00DRAFT_786945 [Zychaea mexicana]KAI9494847.1 hypothetical protein BDB00DRAFT_786945 [Zychaea mexicana]